MTVCGKCPQHHADNDGGVSKTSLNAPNTIRFHMKAMHYIVLPKCWFGRGDE